MKFSVLMKQTLSRKAGIGGLILSVGGLAAVFCLSGSGSSGVMPPFVVLLIALVSMAGTRMLTTTMNQIRAENVGKK